MAKKKSTTRTRSKKYTLYIQGGDSTLRDPDYYNKVLSLIDSATPLTNIQIDQILSISILRGTPEVALIEGGYKHIESLYLLLHNLGIECFFAESK